MPIPRKTQVAFAVSLLALSLTPLAHAQNNENVQRVEITGSNIKRIDAETSSPVQVIRRDDIARSGATSVRELLDNLPSNDSNALSDINGSNSFASGASGASLRNLGKQATLILLNSRRLSPYALADFNEVFTNIDTLPLDAIDRVEILKNGGSAVYGSDAVAGVINIITRKDYQGFQVGGDYQKSLESKKFGQGTVRMTGGFGDFDKDRFNILANVEFFKRDNVIWRDVLSHANPGTLEIIPQGDAQLSQYSYPGNINGKALAGCTTIVAGKCMYDRYSRFEAVPASERANMLVSGRLNLGNELEAFAEVLYSRIKTDYIAALPYYGVTQAPVQWGNASTGLPETFTYRALPATHPLNTTGDAADFRYRFLDAGGTSKQTSDNYRALAGLRGTFKGYDWESALAFMGASTDDLSNGRFSVSGFKETIGDYTQVDADGVPTDPNFFNKPNGYRIGQPNSAEVLNKLFPGYGTKGKTSQVAWDGKVSGELMSLPAGPLGVAAGFDLRHEKYSLTPTANLLAGDIVGFGVTQVDASRNYGAVFAELNVPVTKTLETQVAARIDKFPGFGAHVSPKLGMRFQPVRELLLRGTVEGGFRAPNLTEAAKARKTSFQNGVSDPKRCSAANHYADDLEAQAEALPKDDPRRIELLAQADTVRGNECAAGVPNITSNNPDLKPETSRSFSLGLVAEPNKYLTTSLDYWSIRRKNEIGVKSTQELLAQEGNLPPGMQVARNDFNDLSLDPTFNSAALRNTYGVTVGSLKGLTSQFENVSKTKTDGIDLGVTARIPTELGKLNLDFMATYLLHYYSYSTVKNAYGDNLAGRYEYPRFTATLSAALETGSMVNGFKIVHRSAQALQGDYYDTDWSPDGCVSVQGIAVEQCRIAPYSRLDYFFSYKGVKNLTVGLYVKNLLNRYPPFDVKALVKDGGYITPQQVEDAQRRTLKLTVDYKFW